MPVGMHDLPGPAFQALQIDHVGGMAIAVVQECQQRIDIHPRREPGRAVVRDLAQTILDRDRPVVAAAGGLPFRLKGLEQLVVQRENATPVEGALQRLGVPLPRDIFEYLVDGVTPLEHRVVVPPGADQMGQRKLLARQEQLQRVAKRDFEWIILAAGPAFEQEFSLLACDQQLWRLSRSARKFDNRLDHPDVKMRKDNC